jgi:hypothetical protein
LKVRHNLVLGAGLAIPLGASREKHSGPSQLYQWGLGGVSFAFEPIAGRLLFDNKQGIDDQDLAGVRAGFDMGRLVGLRGFYWRGTNSGFTNTEPIDSWGAEAQLRLNSGPGITPFLLLGGAKLDFKNSFQTKSGARAEDQNSLIAGGGVSLPIAERLAINLSARDYLFSQSSLDSVASVAELRSDLRHNWLISAGLRVSVGGRSGIKSGERRDGDSYERGMRDQRAIALRADSMAGRRGVAASSQRDTVVIVLATDASRTRADTLRVVPGDTIRMRESGARTTLVDNRPSDASASRGYASDRLVAIPVPTEGELYVRYGPSAGRTLPKSLETASLPAELSQNDLREMMRAILREEVVAELARTEMSTPSRRGETSHERSLTDQQLAAIERRVARRMDDSLATRRAALSELRIPVRKADAVTPSARSTTPAVPIVSVADVDARIDARIAERLEELSRRAKDTLATSTPTVLPPRVRIDTLPSARRESQGEVDVYPAGPRAFPDFSGFMVYSGATVSAGDQAVFGLRADIGPISRRLGWMRVIPEVALGFGSGARSTMLAGNVQLGLPTLRFGKLPGIAPLVEAGLGVLHFGDRVGSRDGTKGVLNLGYGATVDFWPGDGVRPALFIEHQGIDRFKLNRVLAGLSWGF